MTLKLKNQCSTLMITLIFLLSSGLLLMPSNNQENLPVAFAMLEKVPDKWRLRTVLGTDQCMEQSFV